MKGFERTFAENIKNPIHFETDERRFLQDNSKSLSEAYEFYGLTDKANTLIENRGLPMAQRNLIEDMTLRRENPNAPHEELNKRDIADINPIIHIEFNPFNEEPEENTVPEDPLAKIKLNL